MKRVIEFRDKNMQLVNVVIELKDYYETLCNKDTLEEYESTQRLSISGEIGPSSCQIASHIVPRTEGQKQLLKFWQRYHLNGMSAGTTLQNKLMDDCLVTEHEEAVRLLKAHELYIDRGYRYGSKYLHEPLPENIEEIIEELAEKIEEEEDELSEELDEVFDMGSDDFKPTDEVISQVMNLRDCDRTEAIKFIALGMYLKCTFGDLDYDFEEISDCYYSSMGRYYYIGSNDELNEIAEKKLDEDEYFQEWKNSVFYGDCRDSYEDWKEEILRYESLGSILGTYDGNHSEYSIDGDIICVARS